MNVYTIDSVKAHNSGISDMTSRQRRSFSPSLHRPTIVVVESAELKEFIEKEKKRMKRCSDYFSEYCDSTTIHGFKYLGEQNRSLFEKVWWCLILLLSLYFCINLIIQTTVKWRSSPIIVGFKQNPIPVWKVPFPAITICPLIKSRQSVFNYSDYMDKYFENKSTLPSDILNRLHELSLVCYDRTTKHGGQDYFSEDSLEFLQKLGPDFNNITRHWCTWRNELIKCSEFFTPTLTDEGICYSFNILNHGDMFKENVVVNKNFMVHNNSINEWDFVKGYSNGASLDAYPYRDIFIMKKGNILSGFSAVLTVVENDVDYACTGLEHGYKMFFHHPAEVLLGGDNYVLTPLKYDVLVTVTPEMMTTSEELKAYPPDIRKCFYAHEKELAFFKIYTQKNCEMECLSNYTQAICGCVAFYMPRTNDTKMCGPRKVPCMNYVRDINMAHKEAFNFDEEYIDNLLINDFRKSKYNYLNLEGKLNEENNTFNIKSCECRPSCTAVHYSLETEIQTLDWKKYLSAKGIDSKNSTYVSSNIRQLKQLQEIFLCFGALYNSNKIVASERKELFGVIELIGNCGGILGLFTGFSFLSGFEIIYFLTLRLWCNIRQTGKIDGK